VPAKEPGIESIVLRVESLSKASRALAKNGITGKLSAEGFDVDPTKAYGLRILLVE